MMNVEDLAKKREGLVSQLTEAANHVKDAEAKFNQVRGAILALDALTAELKSKAPAKKLAKKGKK